MIDGKNFFGKSVNNLIKRYGNIRKNSTGAVEGYTTRYVLVYSYFNNSYQLFVLDPNKQVLVADAKIIQQIKVISDLDVTEIRFLCIDEKSKQTILEFLHGTGKVLPY